MFFKEALSIIKFIGKLCIQNSVKEKQRLVSTESFHFFNQAFKKSFSILNHEVDLLETNIYIYIYIYTVYNFGA